MPAHASWLLAGGGTVQDVKERLNQANLQAAERYLHNLPDTDDNIVDAFERIRFRTTDKLKPNRPRLRMPTLRPAANPARKKAQKENVLLLNKP